MARAVEKPFSIVVMNHPMLRHFLLCFKPLATSDAVKAQFHSVCCLVQFKITPLFKTFTAYVTLVISFGTLLAFVTKKECSIWKQLTA